MLRPNLFRWQYELYPENHTTRRNLVIHLVTVPMFHMGFATMMVGFGTMSGFTLLSAWVVLATCVVLQGMGHRREPVAPVPFDGFIDGATRLIAEQFITFPRFLMMGGFEAAWAASKQRESGASSDPKGADSAPK
ncbi:MAG: hypothetical protein U0271_03850 [Polyangiaceae bacterium]